MAAANAETVAEKVAFAVDAERRVSALVLTPPGARIGYVLAHGAGAGMAHPFLENVAAELAERGAATFRYQFPYMEQGSKRPDAPKLAHATVRAAVAEARRRWRAEIEEGMKVVAGGKSFGGRMTSQAQAAEAMEGVRGVAFFGFPLHPPEKPGVERAEHLADVTVPMLFLQGTNDEFAELGLLRGVCQRLEAGGKSVTLRLWDDADHSFHVPAKSASGRMGKKDADVRREACAALAEWAAGLA